MSVSREEEERIIAELSTSYKNDGEFEKFLRDGGGTGDLDSNMAPLVYALFKDGVVTTTWSCSGHTDRFLDNAGSAVTPGTFVYQKGFILFKDVSPALSGKFFGLAETLLKPYPFVEIIRREDDIIKKFDARHHIILTMDDISIGANGRGVMGMPVKEVPEALARERIKLFYQIWRELTIGVISLREK